MGLASLLPDPTHQDEDNQGGVEDEEKGVQERIHQWVLLIRDGIYGIKFVRHSPTSR